MSSTRRRFPDLWARRSVKARVLNRRRNGRSSLALNAAEQLEQRAMLAVTATWQDDFVKTDLTPYGSIGATHTYSNSNQGVLILTIDNANDKLFMRVLNGNYQFSTDSFNSFVTLPNGGTSMNSNYQTSSRTVSTVDPNSTVTPPTTGSTVTYGPYSFSTIYVCTQGVTDNVAGGPSFEIIGSSQDVNKTLIVDLTDVNGDPLSQSSIKIGGKVNAASTSGDYKLALSSLLPAGAGDIFLRAESVTVSAAMTASGDVSLSAAVGDFPNGPTGIAVAANITATGPSSTFTASVSGGNVAGMGFTVNNGVNVALNGAQSAFTLNLQDADAAIGGNITATNQYLFLQQSAPGVTAATHSITTKTGSTQTGRLAGTQLIAYLANDVTGAAQDGVLDIQASVSDLRLQSAATTAATALNYKISVSNDKTVTIPNVTTSSGDIALSTTGAASDLNLTASIDTVGSFSLKSDKSLTVNTSIKSAGSVSLSGGKKGVGGILGDVRVNADVSASAALPAAITVTATRNVYVNSKLDVGNNGVIVTATSGSIVTENYAIDDPNSRISGSSATLTAASGIKVGTRVDTLTARVTGAGDLTIVDDQAIADDLVHPIFNVNSAVTNNGAISITSTRTLNVVSLLAGGDATGALPANGDVTLASLENGITLGSVVAANNLVTLRQGSFDTDGVTPLGNSATEVITGNAVNAAAIDWAAFAAPAAAFYQNIATISANLLAAGDITFSPSGSVVLKSIATTDGSVTVTAGGAVTATSVTANQANNTTLADIRITSTGSAVTLGAVTALAGKVTVTAGQGILDDGVAATTAITSDRVELLAGVASQSDVGAAGAGALTLASATVNGTIDLTAADATSNISNMYVTSFAGLSLSVAAANSVTVLANSGSYDVDAGSVLVDSASGSISISAGRDLTVGSIKTNNAGGTLDSASIVSLQANRSFLNPIDQGTGLADPTLTEVTAYTLSLTAGSITGFDVTNVDTVSVLNARATDSTGVINLAFSRDADLILDSIRTTGGDVTVTNVGGSLLVGTNGVTAGSATSGNRITLSATGANLAGDDATIGKPSAALVTQSQGTLQAAGGFSFTAKGDIDVLSKAFGAAAVSDLTAASTNGDISLVHTLGNLKIATAGVTAGTNAGTQTVAIGLTGASASIQAGPGKITAGQAVLSATGGATLSTDVGTLAAAVTGDLKVTQAVALGLGTGLVNGAMVSGISSRTGAVSLTLTTGGVTANNQVLSGNSVGIKLLAAGDIDLDTTASALTASTANGKITFRNTKSFSVGADGITAGSNKDVDLTANGTSSITTGVGTITANNLTLTSGGAVTANTKVSSVTVATNGAGDVSLTQKGAPLTVTSIATTNGGVAVTSNDAITATSILANGAGKNVSLTTTGVSKAINVTSITADGDTVTLKATGAITGAGNSTTPDLSTVTPDVKAATVSLTSAGNTTVTVQASTVSAAATGAGADIDLTILKAGTKAKALVLGTAAGQSNLSAADQLTLRTANDIVIVTSPTAPGGITYRSGSDLGGTKGNVTFAVTSSNATGTGSLASAITNSGAANVAFGNAGVSFTTDVTSPIRLTSTFAITKTTTLDGSNRLNLATGAYSAGRQIDIDGSLVASGSGFKLDTTADNSTIKGFAFYGFTKANAAGVELAPSADNVTISGNLFGVSSTGRLAANTFGILAKGTVAQSILGLTVSGNTVVKSTTAGIKLDQYVSGAAITGNVVGTNAARVSGLGNAVGILIDGSDASNQVLNNVVAYNTDAGVRVKDTNGAAGATVVRGNEVLLNGTGISISGSTNTATVAGNTVTRSVGSGISVSGTAQSVTIGGSAPADRNYVGTNSAGALGLGNGKNGIEVTSTGATIVVQNNRVLGNGSATAAAATSDNNGIKLVGTDITTLITGNSILANRGSGIFASGAAKGSVTGNTIGSNYRSGVESTGGSELNVGGDLGSGNGNTINSNLMYGVDVANGSKAAIWGNSMASNSRGGIRNLNATPSLPTVTQAQLVGTTLNVTVSSPGSDRFDVYFGAPQGRVYLGTFTGVSGALNVTGLGVFVGGQVVVTRSSLTGGDRTNTSAFSAAKLVTK